ncbi:MAG: S8 family serine peptidase, partial [Chloroflexota bacterium]
MFRLYKIAIPCLVALVVFELWFFSSGLNKPATASTEQFPETLSQEVVQRFEQGGGDTIGRYIVELRDDFSLDYRQLSTDPEERRVQLIEQRQANSLKSQSKVGSMLINLEEGNLIESSKPLWIINGFVIEGHKEGILELAYHPEVEEIRVDAVIQQMEPLQADASQSSEQTNTNWGLVNSRTYEAWHGLDTRGEGVTIAIMDTGVDFEHPALSGNYRGRNPDGSVEHTGHWFHAAIPTETVPIDNHGHGTHVAGTALGGQDLGVAPGANWIAVGIGDNAGFILESYVHAAFEWMLQPNGDPSLAPDIINGSWGGPSENPHFLEDLELVHAAGIIPVFATGNNGPMPGTINTPAAFRDVISVGATDIEDNLTWFTARGPSIFTDQPRPLVSAPGATVYSALPGDTYGYMSGTSMATPHVAGGLALLLSANPTLNNQDIHTLLEQTSRPFTTDAGPNSGHGIIDAHALVATQMTDKLGQLSGALLADGKPVASSPISVTASSGNTFVITSDTDGNFDMALLPGTYQLTASRFGFTQSGPAAVTVTAGSNSSQNIQLLSDPTGLLSGKITNAKDGSGLDAELILIKSGQHFQAGSDGIYHWALPVGNYTVRIIKNGFSIEEKPITIEEGKTLQLNQALGEQPTVLFVEADAWRYANETNAVPDVLTANKIAFDTHTIRHLVDDMVISETLSSYDVIVWSSTKFSPGYIDAGSVISDYLDGGGNLILVGPNIALYDANSQSSDFVEEYMRHGLDIRSGSRLIPTQTVSGVEGTVFSDLSFELIDPHDASAELLISEIDLRPYSFSKPILEYDLDSGSEPIEGEESYVGIQAGHCKPFKTTLLGFNLRDVNNTAAQQALLTKSFDFFAAPSIPSGLEW